MKIDFAALNEINIYEENGVIVLGVSDGLPNPYYIVAQVTDPDYEFASELDQELCLEISGYQNSIWGNNYIVKLSEDRVEFDVFIPEEKMGHHFSIEFNRSNEQETELLQKFIVILEKYRSK